MWESWSEWKPPVHIRKKTIRKHPDPKKPSSTEEKPWNQSSTEEKPWNHPIPEEPSDPNPKMSKSWMTEAFVPWKPKPVSLKTGPLKQSFTFMIKFTDIPGLTNWKSRPNGRLLFLERMMFCGIGFDTQIVQVLQGNGRLLTGTYSAHYKSRRSHRFFGWAKAYMSGQTRNGFLLYINSFTRKDMISPSYRSMHGHGMQKNFAFVRIVMPV